jgi:dihydrodipicolinate synthase/N-acetylneuraminate lyase
VYEKLIVPLLTFTKAGKIDKSATLTYLDQLVRSPIRRVLALGSTGEGVYVGLEAKCELIELIDSTLPSDFELFVCPSVWAVDDFAKVVMASKRIINIVYLPSKYLDRGKMHAKFLRDVIKIVGERKIYLYHLPKNTGVDFTPDELINSFRGVNLTGLKLSHSTLALAKQYLDKGLEVFYGSDSDINAALESGCNGVVCQNLSSSFHLLESSFSIGDIQVICDSTRAFVSSISTDKIQALKKFYASSMNL